MKLDKSGYQCGATNADMEEYAAKGTSMLILSAHPVLDFVKKHRKDNAHIFTSYDVEATAHHHGIRDSATISMIEQMMCANANRTMLNMFSASSRRIAEMRKEEGHQSGGAGGIGLNAVLAGPSAPLIACTSREVPAAVARTHAAGSHHWRSGTSGRRSLRGGRRRSLRGGRCSSGGGGGSGVGGGDSGSGGGGNSG